jgi:hypothetical protein
VLHGRKRVALALTAAAAITFVALVPASPTFADPDMDHVKAKVDRLYSEAEKAQEHLNDAKLELADVSKELKALRQDQARQQARVDAVRGQVENSIVEQYQGQSIAAVGQVVVSDDPSAFLEQLTTMSEFNDMQSQKFGDYATELKALNIRKEETRKRQTEARDLRQELKDEKSKVDSNYAEA